MLSLAELEINARKLADNKKELSVSLGLTSVEINKLLGIISGILSSFDKEIKVYSGFDIVETLISKGYISKNKKGNVIPNEITYDIWNKYQTL